MRMCRFCGTMDVNLLDSEGIECEDIECEDVDLCVERVKTSIEIEEDSEEDKLMKEGLMTKEEHIREVFIGKWYEAAMKGDVEASMRILVLVRPKKWGLQDR